MALLWLACFHLRAQLPDNYIQVKLSSTVFSDTFLMVFKKDGNVELDDHDAQKIADGYVNVASYYKKGIKVAIEEQPYLQQDKEIPLYVKGYNSNTYQLQVTGTDFGAVGMSVTLYDRFLQRKVKVNAKSTITYAFTIDTAIVASQGEGRFSLLLTKISIDNKSETHVDDLLVFPNPWQYNLFLDVKNNATSFAEVRIRDLRGRVIWQKEFKEVQANDVLQLEGATFIPGIYLLEWIDRKHLKNNRTLKIIKQ